MSDPEANLSDILRTTAALYAILATNGDFAGSLAFIDGIKEFRQRDSVLEQARSKI
jgi:hypothetical protein